MPSDPFPLATALGVGLTCLFPCLCALYWIYVAIWRWLRKGRLRRAHVLPTHTRVTWTTTRERQQRLETYVRTMYHVMDEERAREILSSGRMLRGDGGAVGGGIYFAESPEAADRKAHRRGVCLQARVKLGKIRELDSTDPFVTFGSLRRLGFDSVLLTCFNGNEYTVYNSDQVDAIQRHCPGCSPPKPRLEDELRARRRRRGTSEAPPLPPPPTPERKSGDDTEYCSFMRSSTLKEVLLFLLLLPLLAFGYVLWLALAVAAKLLPLVESCYSCWGCLGCLAREDPEATPGPQAADLGEFLWSSVPDALREQCFECDWFARIIAHPRIVRTRSVLLSVAIVVPQVMMIVVVGAATCAVRLALLCVLAVVYMYCGFWYYCCCVPLWDQCSPEQPTRARRSDAVFR